MSTRKVSSGQFMSRVTGDLASALSSRVCDTRLFLSLVSYRYWGPFVQDWSDILGAMPSTADSLPSSSRAAIFAIPSNLQDQKNHIRSETTVTRIFSFRDQNLPAGDMC